MVQNQRAPLITTVIAVTRARVGGEAFGAAAWQTRAPASRNAWGPHRNPRKGGVAAALGGRGRLSDSSRDRYASGKGPERGGVGGTFHVTAKLGE